MDIDHLNSVSRVNTAKVAFRLLDRMQDFPANEQTAAIAVLFLTLSRELKLSPSKLLEIANNITAFDRMFKDEQDRTFDGLAAYIRGEVRG